jgi:ribulose bisphosphate carboxylase small subunit
MHLFIDEEVDRQVDKIVAERVAAEVAVRLKDLETKVQERLKVLEAEMEANLLRDMEEARLARRNEMIRKIEQEENDKHRVLEIVMENRRKQEEAQRKQVYLCVKTVSFITFVKQICCDVDRRRLLFT